MPETQRDTTGSTEDTLRFLDLIGLFSSQAMIALGKLANPATGKAEKNVPAARLFIDLLEMIERKTRNNLSQEEAGALRATLTDLRLMFVEEAKAEPATSEPAQKSEQQTPPAATAVPAPTAAPQPQSDTPAVPAEPAPPADDSKVKFRKKYD
ncbi:DUF1844 domain-containing protein [bacterium]|nr:DUF1844 domain-containing protein [bacterium]